MAEHELNGAGEQGIEGEQEHGPDCDCGCHGHGDGHDHDHDHGHAHAHDHGHDHAHAHGHDHGHNHGQSELMDIPAARIKLEAHVHEQASTVSATFEIREGCTVPFASLVDAMNAIAERVEDEGAIVGHIKAFAKVGGTFAHASVTAAGIAPTCEGDVTTAFGPDGDVQLVAIVMLMELNDLIGIVRSALFSIGSAHEG